MYRTMQEVRPKSVAYQRIYVGHRALLRFVYMQRIDISFPPQKQQQYQWYHQRQYQCSHYANGAIHFGQ